MLIHVGYVPSRGILENSGYGSFELGVMGGIASRGRMNNVCMYNVFCSRNTEVPALCHSRRSSLEIVHLYVQTWNTTTKRAMIAVGMYAISIRT